MMNKCKNCPNRNSCKKLCEEAEKYAGQDHVRRREQLLSALPPEIQPGKWPQTSGTTENILKLFFADRKTTREVAEITYKSERYVRKVTAKYRKIIIQNIKKSVPLRRI